ncbi:MAG: NRDE family protein [Cryomorphaceae bacterium]
MCTVTYLPKAGSSIVTANRDESLVRNADGLSPYLSADKGEYLIAKEPLHGGTNLAIGKHNTTVLLNGAFVPHQRKLRYRKSRGIVVLDSLDHSSLKEFSAEQLERVEPFTLLRFGKEIEELRWDESIAHYRTYNPRKPLIVASAQLYSSRVRDNRQKWFDDLMSQAPLDSSKIWSFHLHGGNGDPENDMVMNRGNMVQTVSVSQIVMSGTEQRVKHFDLVRNKHEELTLSL